MLEKIKNKIITWPKKNGTTLWKALLLEHRLPFRYKEGVFNIFALLSCQFHRRYHSYKKIIEVNLTNKCNLSCINCGSSCRYAPSDEYMSLEQIKKFIDESLRLRWGWEKIKLYGGEPTLHPNFSDVLSLIKRYKKFHPLCRICLITNGVGKYVKESLSKVPNWVEIHCSTKEGMESKFELFESYNLAPIDLKKYKNADFSKGCWRIEKCGMCISPSGYYVCAPGYHIDRVFGFDVGLKRMEEINDVNFKKQLTVLCKYCGFYKEPKELVSKEVMSITWKGAYKKYKNKKPKLLDY